MRMMPTQFDEIYRAVTSAGFTMVICRSGRLLINDLDVTANSPHLKSQGTVVGLNGEWIEKFTVDCLTLRRITSPAGKAYWDIVEAEKGAVTA